MPSYLKSYLNKILSRGNTDMAKSIEKTATEFTQNYLDTFSFADHEIGLLFGNVQAGKTAQMFGIMCAAADSSFPIFILLTTDSVALQTQTYERVVKDLGDCGFCICGELDKQKFVDNQLVKPAIIVLKKNSKVLLQWYNTLAASSFVKGNSLFIVDDEADAASPNTLVNKNRVSTINSRLNNIRDASIGSVYLQVTGTPQALLLQSSISSFRPHFTCYFEPGKGYLGGEFFFGEDISHIKFIDDGSKEVKNGLYQALLHHLAVSAQMFLTGDSVCNFVIHPGVRKTSHSSAQKNINTRLDYIRDNIDSADFFADLTAMVESLEPTRGTKASVSQIHQKIKELLASKNLKVLIMNGDTAISEGEYRTGSNIIIGGNVLGRGVTFPKLQTLYYTRSAKKPQADTMWQHSRMFGYDRDPGLMSVYLTKSLYKLFADINAGNNSIISQVERGMDKIQIFYPEGLNPTRKNVIDVRMVDMVTGGTNYYPNDPDNIEQNKLDALLANFESSGHYQVSLKMLLQILSYIEPSEDFNLVAFEGVIKAILAKNPTEQGILIVRRGRAVTQGTGSLLSPNDRLLGDSFTSKMVLTMYEIEGDLGWKKPRIWVPNIKLPEFINYYNVN